MRRRLILFGAVGLLVSAKTIVGSATESEPEVSCKLYGLVSLRKVEIAGQLYSIAHASDETELRRGCSHYAGPVILPNCGAWEGAGGMPSRRIGKVGPFYMDGTCDGSDGATRLDDAPPEIIESSPWPPG